MLLQNGVIICVYPDSEAPEQNGGLPPDILVSHPPPLRSTGSAGRAETKRRSVFQLIQRFLESIGVGSLSLGQSFKPVSNLIKAFFTC